MRVPEFAHMRGGLDNTQGGVHSHETYGRGPHGLYVVRALATRTLCVCALMPYWEPLRWRMLAQTVEWGWGWGLGWVRNRDTALVLYILDTETVVWVGIVHAMGSALLSAVSDLFLGDVFAHPEYIGTTLGLCPMVCLLS